MDEAQKFSCPVCGMAFNSQQELNEHTKQMHSQSEEQSAGGSFVCPMCGFQASSEDELTKHKAETHA